ncbi:hypothetical protein IVB14_19115 [Bradyrhizobium sp. 180]|uniref:hypothetical protein n=1 Tax=unclassified Bradyrhizobium TaxID=2631580 RepID=UPI001FF8C0F8|nr:MULTISPECIES: hypothetical protein [unclassified Bradyrhizobium]MCK1422229.1 hypothetical protein [Bradyrhizobium sp. CW12]MCK1492467.1 hypothetical protein [Bradyrhizobium sp. 180]MCK1528962.1 hypothetical protein [Bradyrhizobium sp. 182]MCK1593569.1 hypothetical protein [Bradyrhizobium sp. 164]MCK1618952.1 hypothetical protein [Bradyrhizobium sp. 159]
MSSVLKFRQPYKAKSETSPQRLPGIVANVAALLSQVQALDIQTADDIRRAVFILELANSCIRLIVGQTQLNEATRTTLLAQSTKIDLLIAETLREAAHLFGETDLKLGIADDGEQPKNAPCSL